MRAMSASSHCSHGEGCAGTRDLSRTLVADARWMSLSRFLSMRSQTLYCVIGRESEELRPTVRYEDCHQSSGVITRRSPLTSVFRSEGTARTISDMMFFGAQ